MNRRSERHSKPSRRVLSPLWALVVGFLCGGAFMAWLARDVFLSRYEAPPMGERSADVSGEDRREPGAVPSVSGDDRGEVKPGSEDAKRSDGAMSYIALVLDDCGYNMQLARRVKSLDLPITWAIIPDSPYAKATAELLRGETPFLVHVPMQARSDPSGPEGRGKLYKIGAGMSEEEVAQALKPLLDALPGAYGINNHRGSRATEDETAMRGVMKILKARNLFFLDSATSSNSVAYRLAIEAGLPAAKNEFFLDSIPDQKEIAARFAAAVAAVRAKKTKKTLVAICHLRPETVEFLETLSGDKPEEDVTLVTLPRLTRSFEED